MTACNDPMEGMVRAALISAGIQFSEENDPRNQGLDFYLFDHDIHVEVKQFHSERISKQMGRVDNVIAIQGKVAGRLFADLLRKY